MKKVIIPLAKNDFDPTEVAIPWLMMCEAGIEVVFATADGQPGQADPMMISGEGLDPWGFIPGLNKIKLIGLALRANKAARNAYAQLQQSPEFQNPLTFDSLNTDDFDGLLIPGGHAPKMRDFCEDKTLQHFVADFFNQVDETNQHKPVATICHGVLIAARSLNAQGESVLKGKKTTALTWKLESSAWMLTKFLARFWDNTYYRTYQESKGEPRGHWGVEQEVTRSLAHPDDFIGVDKKARHFFIKDSGLFRDSKDNDKPAWVVQDGNYLSARWPGDAHTLAKQFIGLLKSS